MLFLAPKESFLASNGMLNGLHSYSESNGRVNKNRHLGILRGRWGSFFDLAGGLKVVEGSTNTFGRGVVSDFSNSCWKGC